LETQEEEVGDEVLDLQAKMSVLQSQLATAVSRLSRLRKIKKRVKEKSSVLLRRGMEELDKEDQLVPVVESHERWVVNDLEFLGVPEGVDWASLGLGDEFRDLGPLHEPSGTSEAPPDILSGGP
jgi:hypothetical protein